jgi:glycosidase
MESNSRGTTLPNRALHRPLAIYHAFDTPLREITDQTLSDIREAGFSHIQISPMQKCDDYGVWHAKYQPTGYEIGNGYGTELDLKELIHRAHSLDLKVLIDIVLNHLGSLRIQDKVISKTDWNSAQREPTQLAHYHQALYQRYGHLFPNSDAPDKPSLFKPWCANGWIGGGLPQLNTANDVVRKAQVTYLKKLIDFGIDGFRFDGIEHIGAESMQFYLQSIQELSKKVWNYGEIVTTDTTKAQKFSKLLPITDYAILEKLIQAFSFHGNLSSLQPLVAQFQHNSITFAMSHDTLAAQQSSGEHGVSMLFSSDEDCELATLFTIACTTGTPLILAKDAQKPKIREALRFRSEMIRRGTNSISMIQASNLSSHFNDQTILVLKTGNHGIFILNKSIESFSVSEMNVTEFPWAAEELPITIPKRSANFYIRSRN